MEEEIVKQLKKHYEFLGEMANITLENEELTNRLYPPSMGMTALEHVSSVLGNHEWVCLSHNLYYKNEEGHIIWQVVRERSSENER